MHRNGINETVSQTCELSPFCINELRLPLKSVLANYNHAKLNIGIAIAVLTLVLLILVVIIDKQEKNTSEVS